MNADESQRIDPADEDFSDLTAPVSPAAARLAYAIPAVSPPPQIKQALLARIRNAGTQATDAKSTVMPGWRFGALNASEGWIPLRLPGVRMREVTIDASRDSALIYVEMAPGAVFPEHVHSAPERGLVLTGDFKTEDHLLRAGDFYEAAAGTKHTRISSPSGCTGLLWLSAKAWEQWRVAMAG